MYTKTKYGKHYRNSSISFVVLASVVVSFISFALVMGLIEILSFVGRYIVAGFCLIGFFFKNLPELIAYNSLKK